MTDNGHGKTPKDIQEAEQRKSRTVKTRNQNIKRRVGQVVENNTKCEGAKSKVWMLLYKIKPDLTESISGRKKR